MCLIETDGVPLFSCNLVLDAEQQHVCAYHYVACLGTTYGIDAVGLEVEHTYAQ